MLPSLFYSFYSDDETTGADISQKKPENAQGGINSAQAKFLEPLK